MKTEDIILNKKKLSQPSPFSSWARVVGQNEINIVNVKTVQQHIVRGYDKQVYAFLPVRKGDKIHVKGNFIWGRFYEAEGLDNGTEEA